MQLDLTIVNEKPIRCDFSCDSISDPKKGEQFMTESTKLCPNCREIMNSCLYRADSDGQRTKLENKLYTYEGIIVGKVMYCSKCGTLAVLGV